MLYIPSYRRSDRLMKNKGTLNFISPAWKEKTTLVVREAEADVYAPVAKAFGVSLHCIPSGVYENAEFFGWGDTMDYIVSLGIEQKRERFVIMDDDLKLAYRPDLDVSKWTPLAPDKFDEMMDRLLTTSADIPYMGLRERQFSDLKKTEYDEGTRFIHVFSFYAPFFKARTEFRYRNSPQRFMTDLRMLLSLITQGVNTRTWNRYVHDDIPDAAGGCSTMRTVEAYNESAFQLRRAFPSFVTLRQKTNWGDVRIGTTVAWKRAYAECVLKRGSEGEHR